MKSPPELRASYAFLTSIVPTLPAEHRPDLVLHLGLDAEQGYFSIGKSAGRDGHYGVPDMEGKVVSKRQVKEAERLGSGLGFGGCFEEMGRGAGRGGGMWCFFATCRGWMGPMISRRGRRDVEASIKGTVDVWIGHGGRG